MEQITESEELLGKQIKKTDYIDNHFFLFFTDETFCVFKGCGWDERDVELMDEDFGIEPNDYNYKELHGLGFITDAEKTKYEVELLKRKRAKEVQEEVETLKKLKAKYPNM
jgi:hypothetical protein